MSDDADYNWRRKLRAAKAQAGYPIRRIKEVGTQDLEYRVANGEDRPDEMNTGHAAAEHQDDEERKAYKKVLEELRRRDNSAKSEHLKGDK